MSETWKIDAGSYSEESSYQSLCEIEVEGPRGVIAKVFGRTRKEATERAALVASAPTLLAACEELADCARWRCRCSTREIESGHHVDCWKPQAEEAGQRARAILAAIKGEKP